MASIRIDDIELVRRDKVMRGGAKKGLTRFFESVGFSDAIIDAELTRTIEGASTLVLSVVDPNGAIAALDEFQTQASLYPTEVRVLGHWFALAGLSKSSDETLSITFEDREVNALRRYKSPRKAKRARLTRAEFCRSLVQEATIITDRSGLAGRIGFVSPESNLRQVIGNDGETIAQALASNSGFPAGTRLKYLRRTYSELKAGRKYKNEVKVATKTQLNYYDKMFRECLVQRAQKPVYHAAALLALSGSNLWNTNDVNLYGLPRRGKWTVSAGTDAPLTLKKLTPVVVRELIKVSKAHPAWDGQRLASTISGRSTAAMKPWWPYATLAYREWSGGANRRTDAYEFTRGEPNGEKGESTWDAITRMAGEVGWRCWCSEGRIYFVSDEYMVARPAKVRLRSTMDGVNGIEWSQEGGEIPAECSVSVLSDVMDVDPGAAVIVAGEGAADGKWIVKSVSQSLFSPEASLTLTRAQPRLSEPKGEIGALAVGAAGKKADNTVPAKILAMIAKANRINGGTYLMGGNGGGRYDCSAAVSQLLIAGKFLSSKQTTVGLNNFGARGRGKYFTVYSEGGGGASGHCWIVFEEPSGIKKTFEYHGPVGTRGGWKGAPKRTGFGSANARHVKGF